MSQFRIKKDYTNSFQRPVNKDDLKYRRVQLATFESRLKDALPESCILCFHGTTIWNTQQILKSGIISAQIDREGAGEDVLDMPGKISVSTLHNVWFTIKEFADLTNYKYPAGCIFVIAPKNDDEIKTSQNNNYISNVDFKCEPERLKAIITTPENINNVSQWVADSNLNIKPSIVIDYDNFINQVKEYYPNFQNSI